MYILAKVILITSIMNVNKDENAHRYSVRGKIEIRKWRERDREKKEIWKLLIDLNGKNMVTVFLKHNSNSNIEKGAIAIEEREQ